MLRRSIYLGLGLAALVGGAIQADALEIPLGSIGFTIYATDDTGTESWDHAYAGTVDPTDPNLLSWGDGYWDGEDVYLEWSSVTADLDPFVDGNWAITNTSGSTQIITLIVDLPVSPVLPSSLMYGSSSISVSDANGSGAATLASVGLSGALYNGRIDGSAVTPTTNLFGPGYSLVVGLLETDSETQSFGTAPGSVPGPGVTTSIGIIHHFTLTAGDRATFNSIFSVVVPEPGTLALLLPALAGLALSSRRRPS